jgi:parallel beta-helix repeat protein
VEKARDGDVVILLRGIHNGCGDSVTITKRIAISGEGHLREASIDARNNSPVFRIKRACWIRNVEFDFTGFSEAIRVESSEQNDGASSPLIERCAVKCTGADAVVVAGNSSPTFRDVSFEAKKCGMRVCDTSKCRLVDCKLSGCQTQGLRVTDSGTCVGVSCVFSENGHEGIVATANAKINLTSCVVHKNCGPGVDVTNNAFVSMKNTQITNNVGGVWSWDQSSFELENCVVDGGKSHAILADENCTNCFCTSGTTIKGVCHASENVRQQIAPGLDNTCVVEHPAQPTDLPHENGCFKFEHDMYTRRQ